MVATSFLSFSSSDHSAGKQLRLHQSSAYSSKRGKIHIFLFLLQKTFIFRVSLSPFNPTVGWKRFATISAFHFSFISSVPGNSLQGTSFLRDIF